jgi:hypothetical protein
MESIPLENDIIGEILRAMWPSISEMVSQTVLKKVEKSAAISLKYVRYLYFINNY